MAWKLIRKLMILIMDLVILVLIEVQVNDMTSTSFHTSSLPISLHHPFKLDKLYSIFPICFEKKIKKCKKLQKREGLLEHSSCVLDAFRHCVRKINPLDPMHEVLATIELLCQIEYHKKDNEENKEPTTFYTFGECLVRQYKAYIRKY